MGLPKKGDWMRCWLLLLLLTPLARAWDGRGHRVVAQLAARYMAPSALVWVEDALARHPSAHLGSMETASVWPDRVLPERPETQPLHYIGWPLGEAGFAAEHQPREVNICGAIEYYREQACIQVDPQARAEALAFLIHFVGDVHQPLHACDYYGADFPDGDRGGGRVHYPGGLTLHQLWDRCGEEPEVTVEELRKRVEHEASGGPQVANREVQVWARESYELAQKWAYPAGRPPLELTAEYRDNVRRVSSDRLLQAGLRLASLLQEIALGRP